MSQHNNMAEMLRRLKVRLALADFKRKHGYEKYDLYTLESSLLRVKKHKRPMLIKQNHRYYPTSPVAAPAPPSRRACNYTTPSTFIQSPLSAKRNTPPRKRHSVVISSPSSTATSLSSDDEDAANLLVMLHNMA